MVRLNSVFPSSKCVIVKTQSVQDRPYQNNVIAQLNMMILFRSFLEVNENSRGRGIQSSSHACFISQIIASISVTFGTSRKY
jgi:hypothetical protein